MSDAIPEKPSKSKSHLLKRSTASSRAQCGRLGEMMPVHHFLPYQWFFLAVLSITFHCVFDKFESRQELTEGCTARTPTAKQQLISKHFPKPCHAEIYIYIYIWQIVAPCGSCTAHHKPSLSGNAAHFVVGLSAALLHPSQQDRKQSIQNTHVRSSTPVFFLLVCLCILWQCFTITFASYT